MRDFKENAQTAAQAVAEELVFERDWQHGLRHQCRLKFETASHLTRAPREAIFQHISSFIEFCGYIPPDDVQGYLFGNAILQRKPGMARVYPLI